LKVSNSERKLSKALISILVIIVTVQVISPFIVNTLPTPFGARIHEFRSLNSASSQKLVVDIYTESGGKGPNASIGTYVVGDTIKVFVYVSENCTIEEDVITPDGTTQLRMKGPVSNGTYPWFVNAEYPTGKWALLVKAEGGGAESTSDTAVFYVVEKTPYTSVRVSTLSNVTNIEEGRFDGKVVRIYLYPVGGVSTWDVFVSRVYFGPGIENLTVRVQALATTYTLGYPPGYVDRSITLGDQVEVYGLFSQKGADTSVTLNGSENYYIKKLSTIDESPQIIFFSRTIFPDNLSVRINGIAIPRGQSTTIASVSWNWGDGQSSTNGFPATHTYARAGNYIIMIEASQNDGLTTFKSISINIQQSLFSQHEASTGFSPILLVAGAIAVAIVSIATMRYRKRKKPRPPG
jgi:hypothetical protein